MESKSLTERRMAGLIRDGDMKGIVWCLHCQRAGWFGGPTFRSPDGWGDWCPFVDCSGGGFGCDLIMWDEFVEGRPLYPRVPDLGKVYDSFGGFALPDSTS